VLRTSWTIGTVGTVETIGAIGTINPLDTIGKLGPFCTRAAFYISGTFRFELLLTGRLIPAPRGLTLLVFA
jgi:hypothetical protein